jgi:hypothetical protein
VAEYETIVAILLPTNGFVRMRGVFLCTGHPFLASHQDEIFFAIRMDLHDGDLQAFFIKESKNMAENSYLMHIGSSLLQLAVGIDVADKDVCFRNYDVKLLNALYSHCTKGSPAMSRFKSAQEFILTNYGIKLPLSLLVEWTDYGNSQIVINRDGTHVDAQHLST